MDSDLERACSSRRGAWTRLRLDGAAILDGLTSLGPVRVEVGNRAALLSVRGPVGLARIFGRHGRVGGGAVDLRVDLAPWAYAFAFQPHASGAPRHLAVFDAAGSRLLRVVQGTAGARPAWEALVARLHQPRLPPAMLAGPRPALTPPPDGSVDVDTLRAEWAALPDPQDFHPMLRRLGVEREQAMRLAGWLFARPARTGLLADLLRASAAAGLPSTVHVGNPGVIQAFQAGFSTVTVSAAGLAAQGRGARLRVREAALGRAWITRLPAPQGDVYGLEVFDRQGRLLAQLAGPRDRRGVALGAWTALLAERAEAWGSGLPVGFGGR